MPLCPFAEGEAYERLVRERGISVAEIADSAGVSRAHVFARRKLLELVPDLRELVQAGKLDATLGTLIARIPATKQLQCWNDLVADLPAPSFRLAAAFVRNWWRRAATEADTPTAPAKVPLVVPPAHRRAKSARQLLRAIELERAKLVKAMVRARVSGRAGTFSIWAPVVSPVELAIDAARVQAMLEGVLAGVSRIERSGARVNAAGGRIRFSSAVEAPRSSWMSALLIADRTQSVHKKIGAARHLPKRRASD